MNSPGAQCYVSAPSVSITGGQGGGATGIATLNSAYNCIYSLTVGANCPGNDTITFTVTGGGGSGFSASTIVHTPSGGGNDHIFSGLSLSVINPGTGYNGTPITVNATGKKGVQRRHRHPLVRPFRDRPDVGQSGRKLSHARTDDHVGWRRGQRCGRSHASATLGDSACEQPEVTRVTVDQSRLGIHYAAHGDILPAAAAAALPRRLEIQNQKKLIVGEQVMTANGSGYIGLPR